MNELMNNTPQRTFTQRTFLSVASCCASLYYLVTCTRMYVGRLTCHKWFEDR